jgi:hypothetical protein
VTRSTWHAPDPAGRDHAIVLDHAYLSGRLRVFVDGSQTFDYRPNTIESVGLYMAGAEVAVPIEQGAAIISIQPEWLTFDYDFDVDARLRPPPTTTVRFLIPPIWAWFLFAVAQLAMLVALVLPRRRPATAVVGTAVALLIVRFSAATSRPLWQRTGLSVAAFLVTLAIAAYTYTADGP